MANQSGSNQNSKSDSNMRGGSREQHREAGKKGGEARAQKANSINQRD